MNHGATPADQVKIVISTVLYRTPCLESMAPQLSTAGTVTIQLQAFGHHSAMASLSFSQLKQSPDDATTQSAVAHRILDRALDLFAQFGFDGVTTDQLAQQTSVSKSTIYKLFGPKHELLVACINHGCRKVKQSIELSTVQDLPITEALMTIARRHIAAFWSEEPALKLLRLVISEIRRAPDIGGVFMAAGPKSMHEDLARCLANAMDRHELPRADPDIRAEQFISLLMGDTQLKLLLRQRGPASPAEQEIHARNTVSLFLGRSIEA